MVICQIKLLIPINIFVITPNIPYSIYYLFYLSKPSQLRPKFSKLTLKVVKGDRYILLLFYSIGMFRPTKNIDYHSKNPIFKIS